MLLYQIVQKHSPPIKVFEDYYMNELYNAYDTEAEGRGDTAYQQTRFLFNEVFSQLMSASTKWLKIPESQDDINNEGNGSPISAETLRITNRNKRMRLLVGEANLNTTSGMSRLGEESDDLSHQSPNEDLVRSNSAVVTTTTIVSGRQPVT